MTVHVTWEMSVGLKRLGERTGLPARFTAVYSDEGVPAAEVEVVIEDGTAICDSITVRREAGGPSLTGAELRRLPLAEIVERACRSAALRVADGAEASSGWEPPTSDEAEEVARDVQRARQRRHVTEALLRDVARVYRANPDAPTAAVKEAFVVSRSTAERWVRLARKQKLLGSDLSEQTADIQQRLDGRLATGAALDEIGAPSLDPEAVLDATREDSRRRRGGRKS